MGLMGSSTNGSVVDARAFFDSHVCERVGELVSMGLLISIGTTRDRGAISCQITNDGDWDREYFRRSEELIEWLELAIKVYKGAGLGSPETDGPAVQKPTTRRSRAT
jgi:hypothetical protein